MDKYMVYIHDYVAEYGYENHNRLEAKMTFCNYDDVTIATYLFDSAELDRGATYEKNMNHLVDLFNVLKIKKMED